MTKQRALGFAALAGLVFLATQATSRGLLADDGHGKQNGHDDNDQRKQARVKQGFTIAPVYLSLAGKNRDLVGLGSYLVNAVGGCNDCHTNPSYATGGNPFMGQTKMVNKAGYLAGGAAFGPFISRNITPNGKGLPAGHTYQEFQTIIRTGADLDQLHLAISPLLQVMPWPAYQDLTDRDLRAIYEYLSAIPCIEGGPGQQPGRCNH
jgi:hypothetical protein